jgi:hypothetical protein
MKLSKKEFDLMEKREEKAHVKVELLIKEKKMDRLGKILDDFAGGKDIIEMLDD